MAVHYGRMQRRMWAVLAFTHLLVSGVGAARAQEVVEATPEGTPEMTAEVDDSLLQVAEQFIADGSVLVSRAVSEDGGWIVIHADDEGAPGAVVGQALLLPGENRDVRVPVQSESLTPRLYAMLHVDDGEPGVFEFDGESGLDAPVMEGDTPAMDVFIADVLVMHDQFPADNTLTVAQVTVNSPGWLVIRADNGGTPGDVLGYAPVAAGTASNVSVPISEGYNNFSVWPMLHADTAQTGVFEFGSLEGADTPLIINDNFATAQVYTVPHLRVRPQILLPADGRALADAPTLFVESALVEEAAWLVVRLNDGGIPGSVIGHVPLAAGTNTDLSVPLDNAMPLTPLLWVTLHEDAGTVGTFEFTSESGGSDTPLYVFDVAQTVPINVAPSLNVLDQALVNNTLVVRSALLDVPGWLVIQADQSGAPGAVLAAVPLSPGLHENVVVPIDAAPAGTRVFAVLHDDTGARGMFENDDDPELDPPVLVGNQSVAAPIAIQVSQ